MKKLCIFLLLLAALCASTTQASEKANGDSSSNAKNEITKSEITRTLLELYNDSEQTNRLAAMFVTEGLRDHATLVQSLRERKSKASVVEQGVINYVIAKCTRSETDIAIFLAAFPHNIQNFVDFFGAEADLTLVPNSQIAAFAYSLVIDKKYHVQALPAFRTMLRFAGRFGGALAEDVSSYADTPELKKIMQGNPVVTIAEKKSDKKSKIFFQMNYLKKPERFSQALIKLYSSSQPESRIAAMLISPLMINHREKMIETLRQRRKHATTNEELVVINSTLLWLDLASDADDQECLASLPNDKAGYEKLFKLEASLSMTPPSQIAYNVFHLSADLPNLKIALAAGSQYFSAEEIQKYQKEIQQLEEEQ